MLLIDQTGLYTAVESTLCKADSKNKSCKHTVLQMKKSNSGLPINQMLACFNPTKTVLCLEKCLIELFSNSCNHKEMGYIVCL